MITPIIGEGHYPTVVNGLSQDSPTNAISSLYTSMLLITELLANPPTILGNK